MVATGNEQLEDRLAAGRPQLGDALEQLRRRTVARVVGRRPQMIGRMRLVRVLGAGSFGTVYEAHDERLDRRVAVKVVETRGAEHHARALREAQLLAAMSHPNVVTVFAVGVTDDPPPRPYLVMELIEGQSLRQWFAQPRTWREVVAVFVQAGRGLAAAHARGVLHRDLKPENIMLAADGRVRLVDFGLARGQDDTAPSFEEPTLGSGGTVELTPVGAVMGTPAYMAPEAFGAPSTPWSDQYSLAVALYEGLWGRRPYDADSTDALHDQQLHHAVQLPAERRGVPGWLARVVLRALRREPTARFADVDAFVAALARHDARRWWPAGAVAASAVVLGGAMLTPARAPACRSADDHWSSITTQRVPDQVAHAVVAYERAWRQVEHELCAADELDAARRRCLDERRLDVEQLVSIVAEDDAWQPGDGDPLRRVAQPRGCQLAAGAGADRLATELGRSERIDRELARLRAYDGMTMVAQGLELSRTLLVDPEVTRRPELLAEVSFARGRMLEVASEQDEAAAAFEQAFLLAQRERLDRIAARSASELVRVSVARGALDDARRWAAHAEATLARAGERDEVDMVLTEGLASIAESEADFDRAATLLRGAIDAVVAREGEDTWMRTGALNHLGVVLYRAERYAEAEPVLRRAIELFELHGGMGSPARASGLDNLGATLSELGRYDEALVLHREALAIREATQAADHLDIGFSHGNIALALSRLGRPQEALAAIERAHAVFVLRLGGQHPLVAQLLGQRAEVELQLGDRTQAAAADYERAAAIYDANGARFADAAAELRARLAAMGPQAEPAVGGA